MKNNTEALTAFVRQLITCTACEYNPGGGEKEPDNLPYLSYRIEFPESWQLFIDDENVLTACVNLKDPEV